MDFAESSPAPVGLARFDPTGRYRYRLDRVWDRIGPRLAMVLLNPSTADADHDDPTIRRCVGFARAWGFGSLRVVNLFSLRSTRPGGLHAASDPIGPGNDRAIARAARDADLIVAAWGNHGLLLNRAAQVLPRLSAIGSVHAIGVTALGQPRHPLYAPASCTPVLYAPPTESSSSAVRSHRSCRAQRSPV